MAIIPCANFLFAVWQDTRMEIVSMDPSSLPHTDGGTVELFSPPLFSPCDTREDMWSSSPSLQLLNEHSSRSDIACTQLELAGV